MPLVHKNKQATAVSDKEFAALREKAKEENPKLEGAHPYQHRDGNPRHELMLDNPAVPIVGGPHDGQGVHQPREVAEIELPVPAAGDKPGKRAKYRREGDKIGEPKYVFVPE